MSSVKAYYETYWSAGGAGYGVAHLTYEELRKLLEAHVTPQSDCLDVGCGDGLTCGTWLSHHARSYVGVDIASTVVEQAQQRGLDARVIEDATKLPFPNASFDVVVCTEVLEHLFAPDVAAREIYRVLRPGGTFICTVPNVAYWKRRVEAILGLWDADGAWNIPPWTDPHLRFFNLTSLVQFLRASGFVGVVAGGHYGRLLVEIPKLYLAWFRSRRPTTAQPPSDGGPVLPTPLLLKATGLARQYNLHKSSSLYRLLERLFPTLLGMRLHAVAKKPASPRSN